MSNYALLILSMIAALASRLIKKPYMRLYGNWEKSCAFFNSISAASAAVVLALMDKPNTVSIFTVLAGIGFGVITALQQIAFLKAVQIGPLSYTSVLISASTIIPAFSGVLIWNEHLRFNQIIGIALVLACFVLSVDQSNDERHGDARWLLLSLAAFFLTGCIGVMQKWHQSTSYKDERAAFLTIAFSVCAVISLPGLIHKEEKTNFRNLKGRSFALLLVIICGICIAINNQLNLYLSGVMNSAIFFPLVNGGGVILVAICAVLFFHEKLTFRQWIGLFLGSVSVILLVI